MQDKGYYVVHGWMISELGLKGNELLVYAIIYGFTQIEEQWFYGTRRYLAEATGATIKSIQNTLGSLVEKGILERRYAETMVNGVRAVSYRASLHPQCKNFPREKIAHNDIKSISIPRNNTNRFNKPTVEEVEVYCREKGYHIDAAYFVDYYASKGWLVGKTPMKDWKAAVRTWVKNNQRATAPARRQPEVKFLD